MSSVNLVERDTCPNGYQLVDADHVGKKNQFDLVELAGEIQKVRKAKPKSLPSSSVPKITRFRLIGRSVHQGHRG